MGFARKKAVKAAVAGLAAGAMLLTAMPAYAGIGSGGGGVHGSGGNVGPSGDILYLQDDSNYTDSPAQGWGQASIDYALQVMRNSGYKIPTDDSYAIVSRIKSSCTEAINQAVADKSDGDATQARVIGVAATIADSSDGLVPWGTNPTAFRNRFDANWNALGDKSDDLKGYDSTWVQKVHDKFTDQITTTGNQYPTGVQVVCVAVNNQQPPRDYDLTVTTNHRQGADLKVGSTDPIGDTLHASNNGSGIKENLNGTAIIHYEGQKNGYVAAKTVSKPIAFANSGDTQLDRLATPADFGMGHWQEGRYWIDIQVAKQGGMKSSVDTADKDPSETWNVSAEPPTPPVKTIDEGVSADGMTNRTVIRYGTGKGGYEMTLKDKITADGVDYAVDDYRARRHERQRPRRVRRVHHRLGPQDGHRLGRAFGRQGRDAFGPPVPVQLRHHRQQAEGLQEGQGPRDRPVEPGGRGGCRQQGIRHLAAEPRQELDLRAGRQMAGRHRPAGDQQDRRRRAHLPRRRQGRQRRQRHHRQEPDPGAEQARPYR